MKTPKTDGAEAPAIVRLLQVMAALRDPKSGCAWDLEQDFASIAPYTIEEAYEVADAIAAADLGQLKEELGDLLLQVVFHARMAEEESAFDFEDVAAGIAEKMIRRHPHVFADAEVRDAKEQTVAWEEQKARERAEIGPGSVLDGVSVGLPALTRAVKLQNRAARVGFDWPDVGPVLQKIDEELAELRAEVSEGGARARISEEYGDLLFVVANLARHLDLDPEAALRQANQKFSRRFNLVEAKVQEKGLQFGRASLAELDRLWDEVKAEE